MSAASAEMPGCPLEGVEAGPGAPRGPAPTIAPTPSNVCVEGPRTAERASVARKPWFIAGPIYDLLFFLLPPLFALALGIFISVTDLASAAIVLRGEKMTVAGIFMGTLIHAHLVIVFFRSHGNTTVRRTFPYRFLLVPVVLFGAMMTSQWVLVGISVLATFWDVYHSGLQTFGLGRFYDRKAGNDPQSGRRLDIILNHFLYAGPIVAGATMIDHFEDFNEFKSVGDVFFTAIPAFMVGSQRVFTWSILGAGTLFFGYYLYANTKMHLEGRKVAWPKVFLLVSTGLCSIYTWGFNSWGEAFFIMNFFHAVQYFGLVWFSEKKNLATTLRLQNRALGRQLTLVVFLGVAFSYGAAVEFINNVHWFYVLSLVVSIMHFWYDGFIWSVRKNAVKAVQPSS